MDIESTESIFQPIPRAALEANEFRLARKPIGGYVFLLAMGSVVTVSVYAAVVCALVRGLRRKWLWMIFILVGFGKLTMNWTTGALSFMPLAVQLLSASGFQEGFWAPWALSIPRPAGALTFLALKKRLPVKAAPALTKA